MSLAPRAVSYRAICYSRIDPSSVRFPTIIQLNCCNVKFKPGSSPRHQRPIVEFEDHARFFRARFLLRKIPAREIAGRPRDDAQGAEIGLRRHIGGLDDLRPGKDRAAGKEWRHMAP